MNSTNIIHAVVEEIILRVLALVEPPLARVYWRTLQAKAKLDDREANRAADHHGKVVRV